MSPIEFRKHEPFTSMELRAYQKQAQFPEYSGVLRRVEVRCYHCRVLSPGSHSRPAFQYVVSVATVGLTTIISVALRSRLEMTSLAMLYLFGVLWVSVKCERGAAILNAVLSITSFYYFCVPVHDSLALEDYRYLIPLTAMLAVALVITGLVDRVRAQSAAVRDAEIRIQSEAMRNTLLSAVSHDIKTPLAAIYAAATSLLEEEDGLSRVQTRGLIGGIAEESERLNRVVSNILEMTRLESGFEAQMDWHPLEEIVGAALSRFEGELQERPITINIPRNLPLICVDDVLLEQVFVNLVDNFAKYTPPGAPLNIDAVRRGQDVVVTVRDGGHGFASGTEDRVFEKFFRGKTNGVRGAGLGLAICRAILTAHQGKIRAYNQPNGGAVVSIELPIGGSPPNVTELAEGSPA